MLKEQEKIENPWTLLNTIVVETARKVSRTYKMNIQQKYTP